MEVLSFTGPSNSGKTLTIESLVRHWKAEGLKVGVLKHCPKGYQMDREGKDSDRVFRAGADIVGVAGPDECALRLRQPGGTEPLLLIERAFPTDLDVALLEGFRDAPVPQVVVLEEGEAIPTEGLPVGVIAFVHPGGCAGPGLPVFRPGDGKALGEFLRYRLGIGAVPKRTHDPSATRAESSGTTG